MHRIQVRGIPVRVCNPTGRIQVRTSRSCSETCVGVTEVCIRIRIVNTVSEYLCTIASLLGTSTFSSDVSFILKTKANYTFYQTNNTYIYNCTTVWWVPGPSLRCYYGILELGHERIKFP
jgi:hypothetical protein